MKKFLVTLVLGLLCCCVGFANIEAESLGDDVRVVKTDSGSVFKDKLNDIGKKRFNI
jgi:hypothetical protein